MWSKYLKNACENVQFQCSIFSVNVEQLFCKTPPLPLDLAYSQVCRVKQNALSKKKAKYYSKADIEGHPVKQVFSNQFVNNNCLNNETFFITVFFMFSIFAVWCQIKICYRSTRSCFSSTSDISCHFSTKWFPDEGLQ